MFRFIFFLISVSVVATSLLFINEYWRYDKVAQDIVKVIKTTTNINQIENEIEQAIESNNPEEARMYLSIAETFNFKLDKEKYLPRIKKLEGKWATIKRKSKRFKDGFIKGESETKEGVAGAIASDFTVIGDVRDLKEQYELHNQGKPVSKLIVTLAGVGVGLTATSLISAGSTAPTKGGVSALKLAARSGKLTPKMQKILLKQAKDVFDHTTFLASIKGRKSLRVIRKAAKNSYHPRSMSALKRTAGSMNRIRKSTSLSDSVYLLRFVENTDDLRRIEKVSLRYGKRTKGIMKLAGRTAIGTLRVLRVGTELIVALVFFMLSSLITVFSIFRVFKKAA